MVSHNVGVVTYHHLELSINGEELTLIDSVHYERVLEEDKTIVLEGVWSNTQAVSEGLP